MPIPMAGEKPSSVEPNPAADAAIPNLSATQAEANTSSQTKTKTDTEEAADRLYEERIEEEYAKREGGA
jgi:hypothetical protein